MIRLAVIGNPIAHSRSPEIQLAFAAQAGIEISYEKILGTRFIDDVSHFYATGGFGLNVTLPFKADAAAFAGSLTARARAAGSVNTLFGDPAGPTGDTTDGRGLVADLANHGVRLDGSRILILGAGGAVSGVMGDMLDGKPDRLDILNRTHSKAVTVAGLFSLPARAVTPETTDVAYDLVINGTSAGLADKRPEVPARTIGPDSVCYDMVYRPEGTSFMAWCRDLGCRQTLDGLGMLVEQAAVSFEIWTGHRPRTAPVIAALRASLGY